MKRLLPSVLALGPNRHPGDQVRDGERFCRHYLDKAFRGWDMWLEPSEYDDSLQLLLTQLSRLAQGFDQGRNESFASYARSIIPKRAVDVGPRRILGRNGQRLHERWYPLDDHALRRHALESHTPQPGDPDPHSGTDQRGLPGERDRRRARAIDVLGIRAA